MSANWALSIIDQLNDPINQDQDPLSKNKFIRTAKVGEITRLHAIGISNGKLKKIASSFFRGNKGLTSIDLISGLDHIWKNGNSTESRILVSYILGKYKNQMDIKIWKLVDNWIDTIDHWTSADHLCIEVYRHFAVYEHVDELKQWAQSENFWRRRMSFVALLKHVNHNIDATEKLFNILHPLMLDVNYYVRKAIPWLLRTASKCNPIGVEEFVNNHFLNFNKTELRETVRLLDEEIQDKFLSRYNNK